MQNKLLKVALIGKTNAGKSTLINSLIGKKVSIINKKINTTQELILGIQTIHDTQIIFYDTPGINFLKTNNISQKKFKINLWEAIDTVDLLLYLVDVFKYLNPTVALHSGVLVYLNSCGGKLSIYSVNGVFLN